MSTPLIVTVWVPAAGTPPSNEAVPIFDVGLRRAIGWVLVRVVPAGDAIRLVAVRKLEVSLALPRLIAPDAELSEMRFALPLTSFVMEAVTPMAEALISPITLLRDIIFVKAFRLARVAPGTDAVRLVAVQKFEVSVDAPRVTEPCVEVSERMFARPFASLVIDAVTPTAVPLIAVTTSASVCVAGLRVRVAVPPVAVEIV